MQSFPSGQTSTPFAAKPLTTNLTPTPTPLATQAEPFQSGAGLRPAMNVEPKRGIGAGTWFGIVAIVVLGIGGAGTWWWTHRPAPQIPGMIYIPAGTFLSGAENQPVQVKAFYIDETEVSYGDFCGCSPPRTAAELPAVNVTVEQARRYCIAKQGRL